MIKDMIKLSVFLMIACAISAAVLSITFVATRDRIEAQKKIELNLALARECLSGSCSIEEKKDRFIGLDSKGAPMGYAYRVSPQGYDGAIDMIVGIDLKGRVAGVKILSMHETPGLGMRVSEVGFLKQFAGKTIESPLKAKKDVDSISGATITSQAISDGVKQALVLFRNGHD
jgi:Na+-translocating ferredoxin:NAD+ oxidoreductase subunit G